ncbi:MAG: NADH:ubiquinone oxidoreductase [Desulfuromonas sp.]|nr:MAG: NADH:ubiquinone oxidoreductase [Desulfuromonas sp.]
MNRKRVGFFDLTGCEGCQLTVLNLEEQLLDLLEVIDLVEFRELMQDQAERLDIAFVEGSVVKPAEEERLRAIRAKSERLIALGACAATGGINRLATLHAPDHLWSSSFGRSEPLWEMGTPRPLAAVVPIDGEVPGCPIDGREFVSILQGLLMGQELEIPTFPVCAECKLAELPCSFEQGAPCLGPLTRSGCGAVCIRGGDVCRGCRGEVDNPRSGPYHRILEEHGWQVEQVLAELRIYPHQADGDDDAAAD